MGVFDIFRKPKAAPPLAPPDPCEVFAHEVEFALRADSQVTAVERIAGEFALRVKRGDDESTVFLHNVFAETRELSPEIRAERIRAFLATFPAEREWEWEEARPNLLVAVRGSMYGSGPGPTGEMMPARAARVFAPHLDATEDVYASSRLVVPGWLASMKDRVEGRPLAIIPERGGSGSPRPGASRRPCTR